MLLYDIKTIISSSFYYELLSISAFSVTLWLIQPVKRPNIPHCFANLQNDALWEEQDANVAIFVSNLRPFPSQCIIQGISDIVYYYHMWNVAQKLLGFQLKKLKKITTITPICIQARYVRSHSQWLPPQTANLSPVCKPRESKDTAKC